MKVIFIFFSSVFILSILSHSVYAVTFSLDDAVKTALSNSEEIGTANFTVERSREFIKQVNTMNRPKISAEIHYTVNDLRFYNNSGLIQNDTGFNFGASVGFSYILSSFGLIKKSMEAATLSFEAASASKQETANDLSMRVKIAYYTAILAHENLNIMADTVTLIKKLQQSTADKKSLKDSAFLEGFLSDALAIEETSKYFASETLLFLSTLCASYEPITALSDSFDTLPLPVIDLRTLSPRIETSPKIMSMRKTVEMGLKNARREDAANTPVLNLFGKYSFSDQSPRPILNDPLWIGGGYGGIGLVIPIYDGGVAKSKGRIERLNAYIAMSELERERRTLMGTLSGLVEKFDKYKIIAETDNRSVKAFKTAFNEYSKDYEKGTSSAIEAIISLDKYTIARLKRMTDYYNIHKSLAEIEKIAGGTLY